jgi:hypothetical protein
MREQQPVDSGVKCIDCTLDISDFYVMISLNLAIKYPYISCLYSCNNALTS